MSTTPGRVAEDETSRPPATAGVAVARPAAGAPVSRREREWASTMTGSRGPAGAVLAHAGGPAPSVAARALTRQAREEAEALILSPGATRSAGSGHRHREEDPDPLRTCFERDRDRILHSRAFRRLAGKTQVFVFPLDHQRTRLTHALEVAQVATAVARATGLNVALTEAIALGHDCGHGPGGHASEDAFAPFLADGYHHAVWGADVVLSPLNLCAETLDGIRHHSWSLPTPLTPEGAVVSWADRCAYCAHDLEDAASVGIVDPADLPDEVAAMAGRARSAQLRCFVTAMVDCITATGQIGMAEDFAHALGALRAFNYRHIYKRPASVAQGEAVVKVLRSLVSFFADHPELIETDEAAGGPAQAGAGGDATRRAIAYVSAMTDRAAFSTAVEFLGWPVDKLPRGVGPVPGL